MNNNYKRDRRASADAQTSPGVSHDMHSPVSSLADLFCSPFNWCDRGCERCPLAGECPVRQKGLQRRLAHEAAGVDPDDPEVWMDDIVDGLTETVGMLEQIAREEGVDLDAPIPPPTVISLDAKRLHRARNALVMSLRDDAPARERFGSIVMTIAMKTARLEGALEDGQKTSSDVWLGSIVPNLLLLEILKTQLLHDLADDATQYVALDRALTELYRIIDPLIADVGAEPRAVLAAMVARRMAPSPFCVVEE